MLDELSDVAAHTLVAIAPLSDENQGGQDGEKSAEEIVAFAKWNAPSGKPLETTLPEWPAGCDVELANHFFGSLSRAQKRIMGERRRHWYLELIATR